MLQADSLLSEPPGKFKPPKVYAKKANIKTRRPVWVSPMCMGHISILPTQGHLTLNILSNSTGGMCI